MARGPVTLKTVRDETLKMLGDTANTIWSDNEIDRYVRQATHQLAMLNVLFRRRIIRDRASVAVYDIPDDFVEVERCTWDNRMVPNLSQDQLIQLDEQYEDTTGTVDGYSIEGDGADKLRKWRQPVTTTDVGYRINEFGPPTATSSAAIRTRQSLVGYSLVKVDKGQDFIIEYYGMHRALSKDVATLEYPDYYAIYVRHFAMARALERDSDGQDFELSQHYDSRWEEAKERIRLRLNRAQKARTVILGGGRKTRREGPWRGVLPHPYGTIVKR